MATQCQLSLTDVLFPPLLRDVIEAEGQSSGGALWATANFKVYGGVAEGDHIARHEVAAAGASVPDLAFLPPSFALDLAVEGSRLIEVRFKLEISGSAGPIAEIVHRLPPPFFSPASTLYVPARDPDAGLHIDEPAEALSPSGYLELGFQAIADSDRPDAALPAAPPYPAERNLDGGTGSPPDCWQYNPLHSDSLVVDGAEHDPPVASFLNWQDWDTAENSRGKGMVRFSTPYHQPKPVPAGKSMCRAAADVNTIVLHETGCGWNMDDPRWAPWAGTGTAAHFVVRSDGAVTQMYDPVQRLSHVRHDENNTSIGIEFTNQPWGHGGCGHGLVAGQRLAPPGRPANRAPRRILRWHTREYALPPLEQLNAAYRLVCELERLLDTPHRWIGLEDHGEPHQAGDDRTLFLIDDWPPVGFPSSTPGGIVAHHNMTGTHSDGAFLALFTWLLSEADLSHFPAEQRDERAYKAAVFLIEQRVVSQVCRDRTPSVPEGQRRRLFVDVGEVVRG